MYTRLALLVSSMYVVNLLLCICSWLQWHGTYRVVKTHFVFAASLKCGSKHEVALSLYHQVMPLSWTSFVTFDSPVSRLTCRTSR